MRADCGPLFAEMAAVSLMALVCCRGVRAVSGAACGQAAPVAQSPAANPPATAPAAAQAAATAADNGASSEPAGPPKKTYTVPAGTKVLLTLRSAINTKSAKPGDGVYLASAFPVVVGNRVMIPAGVYVQGVVDRVERAGHVKGRAQLDMHFTSIIFPNGSVVEIPGLVDSLPGARKQQVKRRRGHHPAGRGQDAQHGQSGRGFDSHGRTVGSIAGLPSGHPLAGGLGGIGAGLATAGLVALFTRGADVNIEAGTQVEMVLQRPLILEEANFAPAVAEGAAAPALVPASPASADGQTESSTRVVPAGRPRLRVN